MYRFQDRIYRRDGVELYLAAEYAPQMWNALLEAGKEEGLIPCGLGARDTLRMEAAMPPLRTRDERRSDSTGSGDFSLPSRWQKKILSGRRRWKKRGEPKRERIGLKVTGRGIIREEQKVSLEGNEIGMTTSGTPLSVSWISDCHGPCKSRDSQGPGTRWKWTCVDEA